MRKSPVWSSCFHVTHTRTHTVTHTRSHTVTHGHTRSHTVTVTVMVTVTDTLTDTPKNQHRILHPLESFARIHLAHKFTLTFACREGEYSSIHQK